MSAPVVHVFAAEIKPGKADGYRQYAPEHAAFAEARHPGLLAYHLYLSDDVHRMSAVPGPPGRGLDGRVQNRVLAEDSPRAYEFLERGSERSEVYGRFHDATLAQMRTFGVALNLHPEHLGGFTRLATP